MEDEIWDYESLTLGHHGFDSEALKATAKLFAAALMDKMYELQELEKMDMEDRIAMGRKMGEELRRIVWAYTNVDTKELYTRYSDLAPE